MLAMLPMAAPETPPEDFKLGPYTVLVRVRPDNPAFSAFIVYRGTIFLGRQFSRPGIGDCEWLERAGHYAQPKTPHNYIQDAPAYAARGRRRSRA